MTPDFLILFIYLFIYFLPCFECFFFQVFSKNSLIKNIFEEEKRLIVEHDFFLENSSVLAYLGRAKARTSS